MRIILFVLLTTLLSAPFWWLHHATGYGAYIGFLMWCPGLAAVITLRATGGSLAELGWRGAPLRYVALAWTVPLLGLCAAYAAVCAGGRAHFPDEKFLAEIVAAMHLRGAPLAVVLLLHAAVTALVGVINAGGRALGEELGWRGLMVPEACARFGFLPGSVLVGVVWAAWHLPLLLGNTSAVGLGNFFVLVLGTSVALAWLRLKSRSVWPSTVWHATHNAFRGGFLNPLTVAAAGSGPWLDETGYALGAFGGLIGLTFALVARRGSRRADPGVAAL